MKVSVQISRGIESLFGTHDENIRLLENGLKISTTLLNDSLELEGNEADVARAESILHEYSDLVTEGHVFTNGDLNSYLRVVTEDPEVSLRNLVLSGRQRNFGKKIVVPRTINQRRYLEAIERNDMVFGIGPAGTGKTYLAVAMGVSALLAKRVSRIILTRPAVEAGEGSVFCPEHCRRRSIHTCARFTTRSTTCLSWKRSKSFWSAALLRLRRSRSCAAAPSTTASSS